MQNVTVEAALSYLRSYLSSIGHNPDGDLCQVRMTLDESNFMGKLRTSAMHDACYDGEEGVCRWLYANGAESTLQTKDSLSRLPIAYALYSGRYNIVRWFFEIGACESFSAPIEAITGSPMTPLQLSLFLPSDNYPTRRVAHTPGRCERHR